MATIDKVCKEEANSYILFDPDIVKGLHQRGLVYFDVPVYPDDRFKGELYGLAVNILSLLSKFISVYCLIELVFPCLDDFAFCNFD